MELLILAVGGFAVVALAGRPVAVVGAATIAAALAVEWEPAALAATATVLVAALTATATFAVARRQRSGTVDTSEAADLWNFSRDLMRDLREDLVKARERIAVLEKERHDADERIAGLEDQRRVDRARIVDLETEIDYLKQAHS